MFTGIVQARGVVQSIQRGSNGTRLALRAPDLARPIISGASICVGGVCLTVVTCDAQSLSFDIIPETLSRSTLGSLSVGDRVNLESSLRAGDPLDGHIVQGHVDGTARVVEIARNDEYVVTFEADDTLMPFIIPKGSVAIDGVSLTIAEVDDDRFSIALIPTTLAVTTLGSLAIGDRVNVETDILARTVVTTMQRAGIVAPRSTLTVDMLRENGW